MPSLHKNYPYGLDDNTLQSAVDEYSQAIFTAKADINAVLQFSPLIQLGQYELQRRASERSNRLATRISYISLGLGGVALLISVLNSWSSSRWEERQIAALQDTNRALITVIQQQGQLRTTLEQLPAQIGQSVVAALPKQAPPTAANKRFEPTRSEQRAAQP